MTRQIPILLSILLVACTPTRNTISPYDRDPDAAGELAAMGHRTCLALTGTVPSYAFTTDGCSMFPDDGWLACCIEHDLAYWCGGSAVDRKRADLELRDCAGAAGYPFTGEMMYLGTRLGGHPAWPFPWRWGYGEDWPAGYRVAE